MKRLLFTFLIAVLTFGAGSASASAADLKIGSRGGDVWDVQYRLKHMDLLDRPLDGIYGAATAAAVRKYQQRFGLPADGIVGAQTWRSLRKYTLNMYEMEVMARIVYSEARGEPFTGQVAVAAVVMNRIQSPLFPDNIKEVVFQPGAFTAVADGQYWLQPGGDAYRAAKEAIRGWDPTYGALFYYNPKTATSAWSKSRPAIVRIGNHVFTR